MHTPWGRGWRPWSSVDLPSWCPHPSLWPWPIWPATCRTGHFPDRSNGRTVASTRDERGFVSTEMARNSWGVILDHEEDGILELRWLSSTAAMADDQFKETLELFAGQAEQAQRPFLLIDSTEFLHAIGQGVREWRDREIIPRYNADGPATFPTAWFIDRRHVLDWFRGD